MGRTRLHERLKSYLTPATLAHNAERPTTKLPSTTLPTTLDVPRHPLRCLAPTLAVEIHRLARPASPTPSATRFRALPIPRVVRLFHARETWRVYRSSLLASALIFPETTSAPKSLVCIRPKDKTKTHEYPKHTQPASDLAEPTTIFWPSGSVSTHSSSAIPNLLNQLPQENDGKYSRHPPANS